MSVFRLTIVFLAALILSVVAEAQEQRQKFMRGSANQFTHTSLIPTKYFSYKQEAGRLVKGVPILRESMEVELPPAGADDAVLYIIESTQDETELSQLSAHLLADSGRQVKALSIDFEKFDLDDSVGRSSQIRIYYAKIPKSARPQRVSVKSERKALTDGGADTLEQELELPADVPVDKAYLVIHNDVNANAPLHVDNYGFTESAEGDRRGNRTYTFTLKEKWGGRASSKSGGPVPRVVASFKDWQTIASEHAEGYALELGRSSSLSAADFNVFPDFLAEKTPESTRRIAYEIFKWIGAKMSYRSRAWVIDRKLKIYPKPVGRIMEDREGDCKDLALLFIKALSLAGVAAEPVEVRLAEGYGPTQLDSIVPRDFQFNHVIVFIPELNEYIDPTSSKPEDLSLTFFGSGTSMFSNSYGLHLFSKQLRVIRPGLVQKDMRIRTKIRNDHGKWFGDTEWIGKNASLTTMALIDSRRSKNIADGKSYDSPFLKNGLEALPRTWHFSRNDMQGVGHIHFFYGFKNDPVRSDGALALIPRNLMATVLLKYEELDELQTFGGYCFGANTSEEVIEIEGVRSAQLPPELTDIKLKGIHSQFSQRIEISDERLVLNRHYSSDGKCNFYSDDELTQQKAFFRQIKLLTAATHKVIN